MEKIFALMPTDRAPKTRFAMRAVSTACRDASSDTLKLMWERLKANPPEGSVPIGELMENIEGSPSPANYQNCFKLLHKEFEKRGALSPTLGSVIETTPEEFSALQKTVADSSLKKCWPKILEELERVNDTLHLPTDLSADQIRSYLQDPENAEFLGNVTRLDLYNLGLEAVPHELLYFQNLTHLNISRNNLREFLPVRRLVPIDALLQGQPLFRNWQQLRSLGLHSNKLRTIPDLRLLPPEPTVVLTNNPIQHFFDLPTGSATLELDDSLPFTLLVGSTTDRSSLHHNTRVGMGWGMRIWRGRTQLEVIKERKAYRSISPLGSLLHEVVFTKISKGDLKEKITSLTETDRQAIYYGVWKAALNSYRLIASNHYLFNWEATDFPYSTPTYGEDHAFEDFDHLKMAIRYAIVRKAELLPEETQHRVFGQVYEAFGSPETSDLEWGRHHAETNILLLADLVHAATES